MKRSNKNVANENQRGRVSYGYLVHKLLIKPITRPHSLWNLKNYLSMATLQLRVQKICIPNKKSKVTNNKNELCGKTVWLTNFPKYPNCKTLRSSLSPMPPFVFSVFFFLLFDVLSGCFYVSLSLVAVPNVSISPDKFRDTPPLIFLWKPAAITSYFSRKKNNVFKILSVLRKKTGDFLSPKIYSGKKRAGIRKWCFCSPLSYSK